MRYTDNSESFGLFLVFLAGTLWGTIGVFVKEMESCGATSAQISFLRMFFAVLILTLLTVCRFGLRAFLIGRKTLLACALLGLICHGIYNICYSLAVTLTGVSVSAVLLNIAPVFTFLLSVLLFSETVTRAKLFAILLNVVGCILTVTGGSANALHLSLTGILCGIAAGFCYSLTAIIGRLASDGANSFVISAYSYLFASLFLFLSLLFQKTPAPISPGLAVTGFLYALLPTSLGYLLYYHGVSKIRETGRVPVFASMETVVSALIGIFVYKEELGAIHLLGILLVLLSILWMNRRS